MNTPIVVLGVVIIALLIGGIGLFEQVKDLEARVRSLEADRHIHTGMTRVSKEADRGTE